MTATGAVLRPLTNITALLAGAGLSHRELDVLSFHLTSGWYKQEVVHGSRPYPLWNETFELLSDIHRAHDLLFEEARAIVIPVPRKERP